MLDRLLTWGRRLLASLHLLPFPTPSPRPAHPRPERPLEDWWGRTMDDLAILAIAPTNLSAPAPLGLTWEYGLLVPIRQDSDLWLRARDKRQEPKPSRHLSSRHPYRPLPPPPAPNPVQRAISPWTNSP